MALSEPSKSLAISVAPSTYSIGLESVLAGDVKKNGYLLISGFPCRIVDARFSKTGKHGSCKAAITGIDVLTKRKHTCVFPGDTKMHTFTLSRVNYQVLDVPTVDEKEDEVDVEYLDEKMKLQRIGVPVEMGLTITKLLSAEKDVNLQIIRAPSTNVSKSSGEDVITLQAVESVRAD